MISSFYVDGIESQPTGNVNVKFEGGEVQENLETAENIEVYHVDETTQIANDIEKLQLMIQSQ